MAISTTQVIQITDSIAKAITDFNTAFVINTGTNTPLYSTIVAGVSGTGATATLGRILAFDDLNSEVAMLLPANKVAGNVSSYIASVRSTSAFYQQYYPILDALDTALGGLNAYLTTNSLVVNGWFANAFNAYQSLAISLGYRSPATVPVAISVANYFPYAAVDNMWSFTASGATTFSANAVGANTSTLVAGGGTGQISIYKNNATNAVGGATFTITYTNTAGAPATATYTTAAGTPVASGSLAAGYAVSGAIGSAITAVTATGMTTGEQYTLGINLVRSAAY